MFLSIINDRLWCALGIIDNDRFGHSQWQKADKHSCARELHLAASLTDFVNIRIDKSDKVLLILYEEIYCSATPGPCPSTSMR